MRARAIRRHFLLAALLAFPGIVAFVACPAVAAFSAPHASVNAALAAGAGVTSAPLQTLSARTIEVALEIDRDGATVIGTATKDRPFRAASNARATGRDLEITLQGANGDLYRGPLAIGSLCLDHAADEPPHIAGDTIRLHRDTVIVELPELPGAGRITIEAIPATADVSGAGVQFTRANIFFPRTTLLLTSPRPSPDTTGQVFWPEYFGDSGIVRIMGDPAGFDRRLSIVIVPDGYTYADKTLMETNADALVASLRNTTPYKEHDPFLNFVLVYAYSAESGPDECDCSVYRDTAMGTRFTGFPGTCAASENRCLYYGPGCDTNSSANIALAELRAPAPGRTVVMVNTARYGGCAGARAVYSANSTDAGELAAHELGHLIGGLADEYGGMPACGGGADEVNTSHDATAGAWPEWIADLGAPFEGAQLYDQCLYRPAATCRMRALGNAFCPVCAQQLSLAIFGDPNVSQTAPIASSSPGAQTVVLTGQPGAFTIVPRLATGAGVTNAITWRLQSPGDPSPVVVAADTTTLVQPFPADGIYDLTAEIDADTNFVKPEKFGSNVATARWAVVASSTPHTLLFTDGPRVVPTQAPTSAFAAASSSASAPVSSGGTIAFTATVDDSLAHPVSVLWTSQCDTAFGADGSFGDTASIATTWTAPENIAGAPRDCTLTLALHDDWGLATFGSLTAAIAPGFALLTPADGLTIPAPPKAPAFTWSAGNESSFQVQFSASENPFVPAVTSSKKFKGETSYKPKGSQWKKIRKLAANGASVYWRVVAPAGVGDQLPSLQVFQFTIEQ